MWPNNYRGTEVSTVAELQLKNRRLECCIYFYHNFDSSAICKFVRTVLLPMTRICDLSPE